MIKMYREKTKIKAERFDGSQKSAFGYKIVPDKHLVNAIDGKPAYYFVLTGDDFEDSVVIEEGDWILNDGTDIYSLDNESFNNRCEQLPVIPKFVAEWIEFNRGKANLADMLVCARFRIVKFDNYAEIEKWINANIDRFSRAWLDGYQVEEDE
ncbi:DUF1642 domain-containing protein [Levilactobacillus brevis]|uniref:DUF1642 domain-containing protein n=1 Tax=Levilactobacillus brevis TaxID=1580 RepID=UPI0035A2C79C